MYKILIFPKVLMLLMLCLIFVKINSFAQTVVIQPNNIEGKDATIDTANVLNANWWLPKGNNDIAYFGNAWCAPDGFNIVCRGRFLIDFNLNGVITDSLFSIAEIVVFTHLNQVNPFTHSSIFSVCNISSPWTESTVTWLNRPLLDTTSQMFFTLTDSPPLDSVVINVTDLIKYKITNHNPVYGFSINSFSWDTLSSVFIYTSEYPDSTKHPKLVVSYNSNTNSINSLLKNKEIRLQPNPTHNAILVEYEAEQESDITIYDLSGKKVYQQKTENSVVSININLSNFMNGTYVLTVRSPGVNYCYKKFIVIH